MFKKILVAVDSSPTGTQLFETALTLTRMNQAELMILHVLSTEDERSPIPMLTDTQQLYWGPVSQFNLEDWRQQWDAYGSESMKQLQAYAAEANNQGITAEFRLATGSPGRIICQLAQSWGANLVVVGSRGLTGLQEFLLGSVSNYVLHHAPCSVLTLKALSA